MMRYRSIAIEGLPGAGKTSLATRLARLLPGARFIPEQVIPPTTPASQSAFAANDAAKENLLAAPGPAVLDRYWPSTASYYMASQVLNGHRMPTAAEAIAVLFGRSLPEPDLYLFLDYSECIVRTPAADGFWPSQHFRELVRAAYLALFDLSSTAVAVLDGPQAERPSEDDMACGLAVLLISGVAAET